MPSYTSIRYSKISLRLRWMCTENGKQKTYIHIRYHIYIYNYGKYALILSREETEGKKKKLLIHIIQ